MLKKFISMAALASFAAAAFGFSALAQDGRVGEPKDGEIHFQEPATDVMEQIISLHDEIFIIITGIVILVLGLLIWVVLRYNRKANPEPSKTTHNTMIEVIWTVIPIAILVVIGIPSVKLLYKQDVIPEADIVITATGNQWFWTYEYNDEGLTFDGNMVPDEYMTGELDELAQADWDARMEELRVLLGRTQPIEPRRLLDTDTRVVVPVDTTVKVLVTASDVLHAWTIPAFGFKIDAVPGRTNETWFHANETGTFYGQCSELCGIRHAFMPIVVEVVTQEEYEAWLTRAKNLYGVSVETETRVVENAADDSAGQ